jgi:hypothetical protein
MSSQGDQTTRRGMPLLGLSLGTFGLGLYIASRKARTKELSMKLLDDTDLESGDLPPKLAPRHFSPHLYAFKALGMATVIVGVVAVCTVKTTTWYMDVDNV